MIDDPKFDPVFEFIRKRNKVLIDIREAAQLLAPD